jgi:lactoylglutathione lyase
MASVRGLFETHLTVRDLERSIAFYRDVVGLQLAHRVPERHAAFLWIGGPGRGMLGLWSTYTAPLGLRLHLAFDVELADLLALPQRLRAAGVVPRDGAEEPGVIGWMPAASIYVSDPDGHSIEFLTMLGHQPRPDIDRVPYRLWIASYARPAERAGRPG